MMRNNCQSPVRPCPQPRNATGCPIPTAPKSGPGPVRPMDSCSCSGLSKEQLLRRIATTGFACVDACLMRCLDWGDIDELRERHGDGAWLEPLASPEATGPSMVIGTSRFCALGGEGSLGNSPEEIA